MAPLDTSAPAPAAAPAPAPAPDPIALRAPSRYVTSATSTATAAASWTPPPDDWLLRTWTVTHSTLGMWRSAQNVRITYTPRPDQPAGHYDRVDYQDRSPPAAQPTAHAVRGTNTPDAATPAAFHWRGRGWLCFVTAHWQVLAWGTTRTAGTTTRWAVTWFAPTLFTREGLDLYSDQPDGLQPETAAAIRTAMETAGWPEPLARLVGELQEVAIVP